MQNACIHLYLEDQTLPTIFKIKKKKVVTSETAWQNKKPWGTSKVQLVLHSSSLALNASMLLTRHYKQGPNIILIWNEWGEVFVKSAPNKEKRLHDSVMIFEQSTYFWVKLFRWFKVYFCYCRVHTSACSHIK